MKPERETFPPFEPNVDASPRRYSRAEFLAMTGGAALLGALAAWTNPRDAFSAELPSARPAPGADSRIRRWDVITIGNLSRNSYWGEGDDRAVRPALCTSTLIIGDGFRLLVDPSLADAGAMAGELDRRSGLKPGDITDVFMTHDHADHTAGLAHFPDARWLAAPGVAGILNASGRLSRPVSSAEGRLLDALDIIPTPGHTRTHHSLKLECEGMTVIVAGDAVMTRDFFRDRRGSFNAQDMELSARTIDELAAAADVIIPGHDNYFLTGRAG
jgi:glyoxylase-like metal-dependent hydrolase (beta-lactamase superfamily II)